MADRIAPKGGYLFGNKGQYRRDVWAQAARMLSHKRSKAQVLLMPSIEGKEIEVAEGKGFKQRNMYVVDRNPAIVATLKKRYPYINTQGKEIERALASIAEKDDDVRLEFLNLDFCSHVEGIMKSIFTIGCMDRPFADRHVICVTLFRGREKRLSTLVDAVTASDRIYGFDSGMQTAFGLSENDTARVRLIQGFLKGVGDWVCQVIEPRLYRSSSGSPMMWFGVLRHRVERCGCEICSEPVMQPKAKDFYSAMEWLVDRNPHLSNAMTKLLEMGR